MGRWPIIGLPRLRLKTNWINVATSWGKPVHQMWSTGPSFLAFARRRFPVTDSPPRSTCYRSVADFKTHITGSTIVGVAYGYWGFTSQGMSLESSLIAGGLCSVSGMLPDLDSDSGIPLRETSLFGAAIVPVLMIERFRDMGISTEAMDANCHAKPLIAPKIVAPINTTSITMS